MSLLVIMMPPTARSTRNRLLFMKNRGVQKFCQLYHLHDNFNTTWKFLTGRNLGRSARWSAGYAGTDETIREECEKMSLTKKEKSLLPVFKDIDKHLTDDVLRAELLGMGKGMAFMLTGSLPDLKPQTERSPRPAGR
nr:MAG TPA: hypothetical protein [Caudoviricetes sp.]